MKTMGFFLLFLILVIGSVPASAQGANYFVGDGDVLKITVYDHPDLATTVKVNSDGTISFPLVGLVQVNGLTADQVAEKLTKVLRRGYIVNPQVTVLVEGVFYVTGEVNKPNSYKFEEGTTVIKAISMAGGFTNIAARGKVKVYRKINGKEKVMKKVSMDMPILADDVIVVPESFF